MKNIILVVTITLEDIEKKDVLDIFTALHSATHKEDKGCLQYDVHEDVQKKNTYVFIETWQNEMLLDEHLNKEHFKTFQKELKGKIKSMKIQKLRKIL